MYILNEDAAEKDKIYGCGRIIATHLIYEKHLPLLAMDKKFWYFARTEALEKALEKLPFWLKVAKRF